MDSFFIKEYVSVVKKKYSKFWLESKIDNKILDVINFDIPNLYVVSLPLFKFNQIIYSITKYEIHDMLSIKKHLKNGGYVFLYDVFIENKRLFYRAKLVYKIYYN